MTGMSSSHPSFPEDREGPNEHDSQTLFGDLRTACEAHKKKEMDAALAALQSHVTHLHTKLRTLEGMALEDALTGVLNRHGFFEELRKELARCQRHPERGLCLIMVDLDDFKAINDTLGHPAGDACLQLAATTLRASIREGDSIARLGGDEFALILGDITNMDILQRTQEIRDRLNGSFMPWHDSTIHIHGSVGFSVYKEEDTEKDLIHRADRSLYQQKKLKEHQNI